MTVNISYSVFLESLKDEKPNSNWPEALQSLWYNAKGNWEASHNIAQDLQTDIGSWIHAYLHRKEGDEFNARYWYGQLGKSFPKMSLEEEYREMVEFIIDKL